MKQVHNMLKIMSISNQFSSGSNSNTLFVKHNDNTTVSDITWVTDVFNHFSPKPKKLNQSK